MGAERKVKQRRNQVVGNMGLHYACYELSKRGWNVLSTARNARGVDVVVYSEDAKRKHTIQVKALSRPANVNLGPDESLLADYLVVVLFERDNAPKVFIAKATELRGLCEKGLLRFYGDKFWLQRKGYEEFENKWGDLGNGGAGALPLVVPITR
jgi:hypothetical protein